MEVKINETVTKNAKTVKVYAKCCDCCSLSIFDEDGNEIKDHDGYVPSFMPGEHHGDYIILDIDIDTGKILNWNVTSDEIEEFLDSQDD